MVPVLISVLACDSASRLAQAGGLWAACRWGGEHFPEITQKTWLTLRVAGASWKILGFLFPWNLYSSSATSLPISPASRRTLAPTSTQPIGI